MKRYKLLLIVLLIVGCVKTPTEPNKDTCIIYASITDSENNVGVRYMCYENYHTKDECMDKIVNLESLDLNFTYYDYLTITCLEFCQDKENKIGTDLQPKMLCEEY